MPIRLQNVAFIPHQRNHLRHGLQSMLNQLIKLQRINVSGTLSHK